MLSVMEYFESSYFELYIVTQGYCVVITSVASLFVGCCGERGNPFLASSDKMPTLNPFPCRDNLLSLLRWMHGYGTNVDGWMRAPPLAQNLHTDSSRSRKSTLNDPLTLRQDQGRPAWQDDSVTPMYTANGGKQQRFRRELFRYDGFTNNRRLKAAPTVRGE